MLAGFALAAGCGGGGGGSGGPTIDPLASSLTPSIPFGAPADGVTTVTLTVTVIDTAGNPLAGLPVQFTASGFGNTLVQPGMTDMNGVAAGTLASVVGEVKTVIADVTFGTTTFQIGPAQTTFVRLVSGEFFVRTSGSDANSGTSPIGAWQTIGYALSQAGPGDTIYVGAGTYPEALTITTAATLSQPLLLRGDPAGCFTGDAGEVLIEAGGSQFGFRLSGASYVVLRGFAVRGTVLGPGGGGGVWITGGSSDCAVVECSLYENERGLHAVSGTRLLIENNGVSANFGAGIVWENTADSTVVQNLVYNNAGPGFDLTGTSTNLTLEYNTVYRNAGDQIVERAAGSTGTVMGNVMSEGGADGLDLPAGTALLESHNLAWAHAGMDFNVPGAIINPTSMIADPLFVDPFGPDGILGAVGAIDDDFRFLLASPAFDSGDRDARDRVLRFGGAYSTRTSRIDATPDGLAPDGATVNLGFHYAVAADPFASLESFGARVAFGRPAEAFIQSRAFDPATDSFTAAGLTLPANAEIKWLVHRVSPLLQPEELVAVLSDTGNQTFLSVREWDGRKWSEDAEAPIASRIQSANTGERGFDLAYEQVSGEALIVYSNDDANPRFRTLQGGRWSVEAPVFSPVLGTGTVLWVELVAKAGSDEIALVALDDQQTLFAAIWDGGAWTDPFLLGNQVVELRQWQAFDAAWESLSGRLLVVWGFSTMAEQAQTAIYEPANGSWTPGLHDNSDAIGALVELVSDPASDLIMAAFGEGRYDDDITIDIWDGTDWIHNLEVAPFGFIETRDVELGWLGTSGRGFALYRDQALGGSFNVAEFNQGWRLRPEVQFPGVGRIVRAESLPVPGEERALVVMLDEAGALFAFDVTWSPANVIQFSILNGGQPLTTGLETIGLTQTFSLDFRRL